MLTAGIYDLITLKFNIHADAQREYDLRKNSYVPTYTVHVMSLFKAGFDQRHNCKHTDPAILCQWGCFHAQWQPISPI